MCPPEMPQRHSHPKGAEGDPESPNQTSQRNRNQNAPGEDHPAAPKNPTPRRSISLRDHVVNPRNGQPAMRHPRAQRNPIQTRLPRHVDKIYCVLYIQFASSGI